MNFNKLMDIEDRLGIHNNQEQYSRIKIKQKSLNKKDEWFSVLVFFLRCTHYPKYI